MDNIFSYFFRFPPSDGHQHRPFDDHSAPFHKDGDHGGDFFGFRSSPFNPDDMFRELDEAMSRMMRNFGPFDGRFPDQEQGGDFQFVPSLPSPPEHDVSPRDRMLKRPDADTTVLPKPGDFAKQIKPFDRSQKDSLKDTDLDEAVRSGRLGELLDKPTTQELTPSPPKIHRSFRSISVRTHRDPDGRVEEQRTVVDDEGKQTTVTRSVDGQTVRQTTIRKNSGEQETIDDLINMGEHEKAQFEERWHGRQAGTHPQQLLPSDQPSLPNPSNPSIFRRMFDGLFFPGSRPS